MEKLAGISLLRAFINDSTRNVCIYFLKGKYDVFATFKKWKAIVELEMNSKVKSLRSDNIGEYVDSYIKNIVPITRSIWYRRSRGLPNKTE